MNNAYYKDLVDTSLNLFKEEIPSKKFGTYLDEARSYLLQMHSCNFSQMLRESSFPEYQDPHYWEKQMEEGISASKVVDDMFYEIQLEKQRRHILGNRY